MVRVQCTRTTPGPGGSADTLYPHHPRTLYRHYHRTWGWCRYCVLIARLFLYHHPHHQHQFPAKKPLLCKKYLSMQLEQAAELCLDKISISASLIARALQFSAGNYCSYPRIGPLTGPVMIMSKYQSHFQCFTSSKEMYKHSGFTASDEDCLSFLAGNQLYELKTHRWWWWWTSKKKHCNLKTKLPDIFSWEPAQ